MDISWGRTPGAIKVGGISAILGFVVSCSSTSVRQSNGSFECSYFDGGALLLGILAILGGLVGIATCVRRDEDDRTALLAASAVIVLVGIVHVLRGVGQVGGACN